LSKLSEYSLPKITPLEECGDRNPLHETIAKSRIIKNAIYLSLHEIYSSDLIKPESDDQTVTLQSLIDRLQTGKMCPGPVTPKHRNDINHPSQRALQSIEASTLERPLADFEDVWYLAIAKILDLHDHFQMFMSNPITQRRILHDRGPKLRDSLVSFTVRDLYDFLAHAWTKLTDPALIHALDKAVIYNRIKHAQAITFNPGFDPTDNSENTMAAIRARFRVRRCLTDDVFTGIWDLSARSVAMIRADVNWKYRSLVGEERRLSGQGRSKDCECHTMCLCQPGCFLEPDERCACKRSVQFREHAIREDQRRAAGLDLCTPGVILPKMRLPPRQETVDEVRRTLEKLTSPGVAPLKVSIKVPNEKASEDMKKALERLRGPHMSPPKSGSPPRFVSPLKSALKRSPSEESEEDVFKTVEKSKMPGVAPPTFTMRMPSDHAADEVMKTLDKMGKPAVAGEWDRPMSPSPMPARVTKSVVFADWEAEQDRGLGISLDAGIQAEKRGIFKKTVAKLFRSKSVM
jgi:hypothetical protein